RFPLEAGVPPEFAVMDERSAGEALAEAAEAVINAARTEAEPGLAAPLSRHPGEGRDLLISPQSRSAVDPGLRRDDSGGLAEALAIVARYAPEERFIELMTALAGERGKLRQALAQGGKALRRRLCRALAVSQDASRESLVAAF